MSTHEFTLILDRIPADAELDALFEAGLDDATPGSQDGHGVLEVAREAESLAAAIVSTVAQVELAGLRAVAVADTDLVSLRTVADRLGRSYESVRLYATGKRGPGGFPPAVSGDGWSLVSWPAVAAWAREHLRLDVQVSEREQILSAASHLLAARALTPADQRASLAPLVAA